MTLQKDSTSTTSTTWISGTRTTSNSSSAKHSSSSLPHKKKATTTTTVRFSILQKQPSVTPQLVGDHYLQASNTKRRYMRRGSKSPSMLAIHAVRFSAEVAACEAHDLQQETLEKHGTSTSVDQEHLGSLRHVIRRSLSSSLNDRYCYSGTSTASNNSLVVYRPPTSSSSCFPSKESVNHDLARSLFHMTNLTTAQKRRLSLEILSRVTAERAIALPSLEQS